MSYVTFFDLMAYIIVCDKYPIQDIKTADAEKPK